MTGTNRGRSVRTTETSLAIIDMIQERNGASMSEIADKLEISRSSVHNHLATLKRNGYLAKRGSTYVLGLKFLNLGKDARNRSPVYKLIERRACKLCQETNLLVDFNVEDGGRVISLFSYSNDQINQITDQGHQIGNYHYMHCSANGKAILANYPDSRVEEIIDQWGLPRVNENTVTEREELFGELDSIRDQGYALNDQEHQVGIRAVGKTIMYADRVIGGLSVAGPIYQINDQQFQEEMPEILRQETAELEEEIESRELDLVYAV